MKKNIWFCVALLLTTLTSLAQSNSEKKSINGTYKCTSISYGDYYTYDVKKDIIEVGSKFASIIASNEKRLGPAFLETLRKEAAAYASNCSLVINSNQSLEVIIGGKRTASSFTFKPKYIDPREGSIESDIDYNLAHINDLAIIQIGEGNRTSFSKDGNTIYCLFFTDAEEASSGDFSAAVFFSK